jgi:integrase
MRYRPLHVAPVHWMAVRQFVIDAVLAYGPTDARIAIELIGSVTQYVLWATNEQHAPLDNDDLFYPSLMNRFIRSRSGVESTRTMMRSRLYRVANAVAGVERHCGGVGGRPAAPLLSYSRRELAELESWARTVRNLQKRRAAHIALAFAGGAGLTTGELLNLRGEDVLHTSGGISVCATGGTGERTVPVRADWAHYLDRYLDTFIDGELLLYPANTGKGRPTAFRTVYMGGHPAPDLQRLRDTWMLDVISRFPIPVVLAVAGGGLSSLQRYLDAVALDTADQYDTALRTPSRGAANTTHEENTSQVRRSDHDTRSAAMSASDLR